MVRVQWWFSRGWASHGVAVLEAVVRKVLHLEVWRRMVLLLQLWGRLWCVVVVELVLLWVGRAGHASGGCRPRQGRLRGRLLQIRWLWWLCGFVGQWRLLRL